MGLKMSSTFITMSKFTRPFEIFNSACTLKLWVAVFFALLSTGKCWSVSVKLSCTEIYWQNVWKMRVAVDRDDLKKKLVENQIFCV